jgi:hypothetical protein
VLAGRAPQPAAGPARCTVAYGLVLVAEQRLGFADAGVAGDVGDAVTESGQLPFGWASASSFGTLSPNRFVATISPWTSVWAPAQACATDAAVWTAPAMAAPAETTTMTSAITRVSLLIAYLLRSEAACLGYPSSRVGGCSERFTVSDPGDLRFARTRRIGPPRMTLAAAGARAGPARRDAPGWAEAL